MSAATRRTEEKRETTRFTTDSIGGQKTVERDLAPELRGIRRSGFARSVARDAGTRTAWNSKLCWPLPLLSALSLAAAAACGGQQPPPPAQSRARAAAHPERPPATSGLTCGSCHPSESADWSGSLHHDAFRDRDFQQSFKLEPLAFCFDCHAPEARGREDVVGMNHGVGCASCHDVAGHPERATTTKGCRGCHEFAFPGRPTAMQSTLSEHASSPERDVPCAACHMPRTADGHVDHRFAVSRNPALLRAALGLAVRRTSTGIAITLTPRHVGHALPTGDLFRRLRVVTRATAPDGRPLGEDEILLGRRFDRRTKVPVEREDTRLRGEKTFAVEGDWLTAAATVDVEVLYERVAQTLDVPDVRGGYQRRETVFDSVVIATKSLGN